MHIDALWWVVALSAVAGLVSYRDVFNLEDEWILIVLKLLSHLTMSLFVGLMSYHFAVFLSVPPAGIPLFVGIGAWRGAKTLDRIERELKGVRRNSRRKR